MSDKFPTISRTFCLIAFALAAIVSASCATRDSVTETPTSISFSTILPTRTISTVLPTRTIISSDLPLHEIWRETLQIGLGSGSVDTPSSRALVTTQDTVYVVKYHPVADSPLTPWQVIALDVETGTPLWATEQIGHVHSLAISEDVLFVATSLGIRAYDVASGKRKWISNQPPPDHEAHSIFYDEPQLYLVIRRGPQFRFSTIDPKSGLVGEVQESDGIIVKIDSQFRYMQDGQKFWVEDVTTNRARWEIPISRSPIWPIKSGNLLVIPAVRGDTGWHSVTVVDIDNGQTAWECFDCYVSDVALDQDKLYAILRDGSLAAYDIKSGRQVGRIWFAGGSQMEPLNTQYSIAAANGFVFLYFEDGQELIALGP